MSPLGERRTRSQRRRRRRYHTRPSRLRSPAIALSVFHARGALNRPIGQLLLAAATLNELIGVTLLAAVDALVERSPWHTGTSHVTSHRIVPPFPAPPRAATVTVNVNWSAPFGRSDRLICSTLPPPSRPPHATTAGIALPAAISLGLAVAGGAVAAVLMPRALARLDGALPESKRPERTRQARAVVA